MTGRLVDELELREGVQIAPAAGVTVAWEFADGSGGDRTYPNADEAEAMARGIAQAWPQARVWLGADQLQRGFIASDERGEFP